MPDHSYLRTLLDGVLAHEADHTRRLLKSAAIIEEAIRNVGLDAILVGGGAVEIYAPGAYTTTDIDFVVTRRWGVEFDKAIRSAMTGLDFSPLNRHWVREELFVEIPSTELKDPVAEIQVGPLMLRVLRKESILAYRIVGYKQWKYTDYAAQAIALIRAFGDELDESVLLPHLRREGSEDAYRFLCELAFSDQPITDEILRKWLDDVDL